MTSGNTPSVALSSFSEEKFLKKLSLLSNSQNSIQTVSHWVVFHRESISDIVDIWMREFLEARPSRKLLLFYLANDAMQTCLKKYGSVVSDEFSRVLPKAAAVINDLGDESIKRQTARVLAIWQERQVVSTALLNELATYIATDSTTRNPESPSEKKSTSQIQPSESGQKLTNDLSQESGQSEATDPLASELNDHLNSFEPSERTLQVMSILDNLAARTVSSDILAEKFSKLIETLKGAERALGAENEYNIDDIGEDLIVLDAAEAKTQTLAYAETLNEQINLRADLSGALESLLEDPPSREGVMEWSSIAEDAEAKVGLLSKLKTLTRQAVKEEQRLAREALATAREEEEAKREKERRQQKILQESNRDPAESEPKRPRIEAIVSEAPQAARPTVNHGYNPAVPTAFQGNPNVTPPAPRIPGYPPPPGHTPSYPPTSYPHYGSVVSNQYPVALGQTAGVSMALNPPPATHQYQQAPVSNRGYPPTSFRPPLADTMARQAVPAAYHSPYMNQGMPASNRPYAPYGYGGQLLSPQGTQPHSTQQRYAHSSTLYSPTTTTILTPQGYPQAFSPPPRGQGAGWHQEPPNNTYPPHQRQSYR